MEKHYDYLVVGAGLFGAVFSYEMKELENFIDSQPLSGCVKPIALGRFGIRKIHQPVHCPV